MISLSSSAERYSQTQNKTFLAECSTLFSELFPNEKLENTPVSAYEWRKAFFERREILKESLMEQTGGMVEISTENPQAFYESFGNYLKIKKGVKFVNLVEQLIPQDKEEHREKVLEETISKIKAKVAENIDTADGIYALIDGNKHDIAAKRIEPENLIALVEMTNKVEGDQKRKVVLNYLSQSREKWLKAEVIIDFFAGITEEQFVAFASCKNDDDSEAQTYPQVENLFEILCKANVEKLQILFGALKSEFLADLIGSFPQDKLITLKRLFTFSETQRLIQIFEKVPFEKIYGLLVDINNVRNFTDFLEITKMEKVILLLNADIKSGGNLQSMLSDFQNGLDITKFAEFVNTYKGEIILECFRSFKRPGILFLLINSGLFASFLFFVNEKNSIKDVYEKITLLRGRESDKVLFLEKLVVNLGIQDAMYILGEVNMDNFAHFVEIVGDDLKVCSLIKGIGGENFRCIINLGGTSVRNRLYEIIQNTNTEQCIRFVNNIDIRSLIKLMRDLPAPYSVDLLIKQTIEGRQRYKEFFFQADIELLKKIFEGGESSGLLQRLKNLLDGREIKRNFFRMNQGPYSIPEIINMMQ